MSHDLPRLRALAERIAAATGPDGALRREVLEALGFGLRYPHHWSGPDGKAARWAWDILASIDAAVALCEMVVPGAQRTCLYTDKGNNPPCVFSIYFWSGNTADAGAATPALAIVHAVVLAVIAREEGR